MKTQIVSVSKTINASAIETYKIIADYRNKHSQILPKRYFLSLDVEESGFGKGIVPFPNAHPRSDAIFPRAHLGARARARIAGNRSRFE